MRSAAIFGLGSSLRDLQPFKQDCLTEWSVGLPDRPEGLSAILVFGGDGTIHRHLGRLVALALPVLVVPAGSGNDFARAFGIRNVRDSLQTWRIFAAGTGKLRAIDLGLITPLGAEAGRQAPSHYSNDAAETPRYFSCAAGVGLDGEISRRANALPRWLRRHGGYALSLVPTLLNFKAFAIKLSIARESSQSFVPQRERKVWGAVFANTPFYGGGMQIAPKAVMNDGLLDACLIADMSRLKLMGVFPTVYAGRHLGIREVEYLSIGRARVETERPMDVYADGEFVCRTPVEFGVARGALRVIVP